MIKTMIGLIKTAPYLSEIGYEEKVSKRVGG
jgi:hypothetical protein